MADNVTANPGVGGATFGSDDIAGIQYPRSKIIIGANGVNDGDVSAANPLPITAPSALSVTATPGEAQQVLGTDTYTEGTSEGITVGGVRRDADTPPVNTTNEFSPFVFDARGALKVEVFSGETLPVSGTITASQATASSLNATVVGTGTFVTQSTVTNAGTFAVQATPPTSGGLLTMNATSSDGGTALTSTAQAIKASAGQVFGYYIYNPNATAQFVQFYNTAAASVTVGTTNPQFMLVIPATSAANLMGTMGIEFTNAGFSWAATSTAGGAGAPSSALEAVVWYK